MSCAALEPITNPRHFKSRGLGQAYALREFAWEGMTALRLALTDKHTGKVVITRHDARDIVAAICGMMKSWELADDRIRIHRGKPLPGSLRPAPKTPKKPRKEQHSGPLGTIGKVKPNSDKAPVNPAKNEVGNTEPVADLPVTQPATLQSSPLPTEPGP